MASNKVEIMKSTTPAANANLPDIWRSLRTEMEQMFDRAASSFQIPSLRGFGNIEHLWPQSLNGFVSLAVDVTEDDKGYTIKAELPGMDEKDVEVTLGDDYISVKGEKRQEKEDRAKNQYLCERSYGAFQRSFALPANVDRKAVEARFSKGILTINMPKVAQASTQKRVEIKAA